MVKMFEIKMEVLAHPNFSIDDIRSNIKDSLDENINIDLTHIRVKISEKKAKEWIIDIDRKLPKLALRSKKHENWIFDNKTTII